MFIKTCGTVLSKSVHFFAICLFCGLFFSFFLIRFFFAAWVGVVFYLLLFGVGGGSGSVFMFYCCWGGEKNKQQKTQVLIVFGGMKRFVQGFGITNTLHTHLHQKA